MSQLSKKKIVEIAKDVILQIKAKKLYKVKADNGYLRGTVDGNVNTVEGESTIDLRDLFKGKKVKNCEVCARGAMLVSHALLNDNCKLRVVGGGLVDHLDDFAGNESQEVFGDFGLEVEAAFEGTDEVHVGDNYLEGPWRAVYPDPSDRLVAIMKNVIANKGAFKSNIKLVVE